VKQLRKALQSKNPEKLVRQLIGYFVGYLNKENLQTAINENIDLFALVCNHYNLTNPTILPIFKAAMRLYWPEFEEAITNVPRIYALLMKNPENIPILQTPQAIQYLNTQCENFYLQTYEIVWS
jgi:glutamate racemase